MQLFDRLITLFKDLSPIRTKSLSHVRTTFPLPDRTRSSSPDHTRSPSPDRTRSPSPVSTKSQLQLNSFEDSPFKKLSVELIRSIAEFLPLTAAVSFTVTCRPVWFVLGSQYLDRLRARDQLDKPVFLDLLQRDLPRHILCLDCELLHSRTQRQLITHPGGELPPCIKTDYMSSVNTYIQYGFDSVTFLLAMKLHRHGLDCGEQLFLLSGFGTISKRTISNTEHIYHWESAPRIVNGHFLLRHQIWLLFAVGREVVAPDLIYSCVCPHWNYMYSTRYIRKLACRASHWDDAQLNSKCRTCSGLFQCKICPTEFQVDAKDFSEHGVALILTRWLDLGEGRNLLDHRYASHVDGYRGDPVPFEAGSIRAAYEGGNFATEKLLTPKYKADMFMHKLWRLRAPPPRLEPPPLPTPTPAPHTVPPAPHTQPPASQALPPAPAPPPPSSNTATRGGPAGRGGVSGGWGGGSGRKGGGSSRGRAGARGGSRGGGGAAARGAAVGSRGGLGESQGRRTAAGPTGRGGAVKPRWRP